MCVRVCIRFAYISIFLSSYFFFSSFVYSFPPACTATVGRPISFISLVVVFVVAVPYDEQATDTSTHLLNFGCRQKRALLYLAGFIQILYGPSHKSFTHTHRSLYQEKFLFLTSRSTSSLTQLLIRIASSV